ncbi:MAG: hypothetical protein HYZ11_07085 [Candidatus Tectomicrobia bacterium]|uniref:Uncharacterized protein n=1 Tax=Tectimicrobiota bacterium TaxID=2528274 RepID=A0A932I057_UNCTE|nr:hypothetical protein [Candidatus Tectomicrobia bacterium]
MVRHRREMMVGVCFLAVFLAVLGLEVRRIQSEADAMARRLSLELARSGGRLPRILQPFLQEGELESMNLFDREGRLVHESINLLQEGEPGLRLSVRSAVRDLGTGREIFHLVAYRDIHGGAVRAGLAGLAAALLAGLALWLAGRRRGAEPAASA